MNPRSTLHTAAFLGVFAFATSLSGFAATLVGWDFDPLTGGAGNYGPSPFSASSLASGVSSSGLVRGSGIGTTSNSGAGNAWGGNDFIISSPSFSAAVAGNEFATFTIVADPGFSFSIDSISAYNIRRSATGPSTGLWQYSLDGSVFVDIGSSITWGSTTSASGNAQSSISLSGVSALQNISSVTFRVVTWGATATGGTWYLNDPAGTVGLDFSVVGSVSAVPEPSSFAALAGVGALGFCALRRRRSV